MVETADWLDDPTIHRCAMEEHGTGAGLLRDGYGTRAPGQKSDHTAIGRRPAISGVRRSGIPGATP